MLPDQYIFQVDSWNINTEEVYHCMEFNKPISLTVVFIMKWFLVAVIGKKKAVVKDLKKLWASQKLEATKLQVKLIYFFIQFFPSSSLFETHFQWTLAKLWKVQSCSTDNEWLSCPLSISVYAKWKGSNNLIGTW